MGASATYALPWPEPGDPADVPTDVQELCNRIEAILVPGSVAGQIPSWDNVLKRWTPVANYPLTPIADTVLGAVAGSVDFQNIPQTFKHLLVLYHARGDTAATGATLGVRPNNDAAGTYYSQGISGAGTVVSGFEQLVATIGRIGRFPAASALANSFGGGIVFVPNYAVSGGPTHSMVGLGGSQGTGGTGSTAVELDFCNWFAGTAISRIVFLPSAGSFVASSRFTLYGLA